MKKNPSQLLSLHTCYLILLATVLLNLFQHKDHLSKDIQGFHSWRQCQTMWNVRNFARHDANILNPRISSFNITHDNILRYEFPIMQWTIGMFQRAIGENILWVRLFLFLIGAMATLGIFKISHFFTQNRIAALLAAILFLYAPVFYYYSINPLPDLLALSSSIWYVFFILKYIESKKRLHLILASTFILLATLCKLPYLMFSIISILYFVKYLFKNKFDKGILYFAIIQLVFLLPAVLWYAWVIPTWSNNPVMAGIFSSKTNSELLLNIFEYHKNVMFPHTLLSKPSWVLAILGVVFLFKHKRGRWWILSLVLITFLYLILEFVPIGKEHDYYMLPFLPWLYFVCAIAIYQLQKITPYSLILIIPCVIWSIFYTPQKNNFMWNPEHTGLDIEIVNSSEELKKAVPAGEKCIVLKDNSNYVLSYRVDKMGYLFKNDHLPIGWIDDLVRNYNIKYMYSNSTIVNNKKALVPYVEKILIQRGDMKVFKLKLPTANNDG